MNGSKSLVKTLRENGIKYIFGYTGGAIMPVFDELLKEKGIQVIRPRHEQGGAFMAQGLSRASINQDNFLLGVCMSTSGPGAMNMVTGVADAYMDSVPMLVISGQVTTNAIGTDAFQESDVTGVMMPISKQTYMPTNPSEIKAMTNEAIQLAKKGRGGPVCIDIPKDSLLGEVNKEKTDASGKDSLFEVEESLSPNSINPGIIKELNNSKRPLIIAGRGIINSKSCRLLNKFVTEYKIPVTFTLHGLSSIPSDYKMNLGMAGMHGTVQANSALDSCDLLISLGMRFDDRITGDTNKFCPKAKIIHIEIDPSEINKNIRTDIGINGNVKDFLTRLLKSKFIVKHKRSNWFSDIKRYKQELKEEIEIKKGVGPNKKLLLKRVIKELSSATKGKDILVSDVGQHEMIAARYYNFQTPNSFFASGGAGTMGCALPMSIGVKIARPKEKVWCIAGDGSFQMNIQELGTLKQYNLDIKILISSNNTLGMVRQWQTLFFNKRYAETDMKFYNLEKIADAYEIPYRKVSKVPDIEKSFELALDTKGPIILDFQIDEDEMILPMVPSGKTFSDMIISLKK